MILENPPNAPWYQKIRRWGQINLTEDDPQRDNLEFWKTQWKKTGVQGIIVNCDGIVSYCQTTFTEQYKACKLGDRDTFKEYMDAATSMGIAVVARMDTNRATEDFCQRHPQWFCVDKRGRPILKQGRCVICANSAYVEEYLGPLVRQIIEKYHPASFAENSWSGLDQETICYCENCRKSFYAETGCDLPENVNWDDGVFRKWIRWNYQKRLENWDRLNAVTHAAGGVDCYYIGMIHADPANPGKRFVDIRALAQRTPIIFTDHQSRDALNGFEQSCINGLLLREAAGRDVIIPQSNAFYVRGSRTFRLSSAPLPEPEKWLESGAAGGISPWFHHVSAAEYDKRQFKNAIPFFKWHKKTERYLYDRCSLAQVGIVWSRENTDFYGRNARTERVAYPWSGWTSALTEARIPFLPVHADDLQRAQEKLRTLVLPDIAAMRDEQIDALIEFADKGGNLVLTGKTATLDADGQPRALQKLWDYLGIRFTGETVGSFKSQTADWEHPVAHSYLTLDEKEHALLGGFEETELMGFGGGAYIVESMGSLRQICGYVPAFPIFPPEFSWIREVRRDIGTVFAGEIASGARIVYFSADIDRCYGRDRLPDHAMLLANAVRWTLEDVPGLKVEGPGRLLVHAYSQRQNTILHIVNMSCCDHMPGYVTEIYPVGPIKVELPVVSRVRSVEGRVNERAIPFEQMGEKVSFTIDQVKEHELIVII